MKSYIEQRAVEVANFIISSKSTVRETAKKFGISKSTVHTAVTKKTFLSGGDFYGSIESRSLLSCFHR